MPAVGNTFLSHTYICCIAWQHFMDGMHTLHCMAGMYQRAPYHTRAAVHEPAPRRTVPMSKVHVAREEQEPPFKPHLVSVHALQVPSLVAGMGHIPK
jgi:hypothetical protein